VLVPGVTGDHTHCNALAPLLEPHFNLWMVHRRGRGESRAVIHEPGPRSMPDLDARIERMDALLARGEREAVLEAFYASLPALSPSSGGAVDVHFHPPHGTSR
jgi:hypothetical protein